MVSASQWRQKRTKKFKAPSGDEYVLHIPDPITLIDAWKKAGVEAPFDEKDLGEKTSQPEVVAKVLMQFILEPKISEKPTEKTLGINELLEDQTDSLAIYQELLRPFTEHPDEVAQFFRGLQPSNQSGSSRSPVSPASNRSVGPKIPGSIGKARVELSDSRSDDKMATRTGDRRRGPESKKGEN